MPSHRPSSTAKRLKLSTLPTPTPATKRLKFSTPLPTPAPTPTSTPSLPSTRSKSFISAYDPGSDTEEEDMTEQENHYLNRMTDASTELPVQTVFGSPDEIDVWKSINGMTYVKVKEEVLRKAEEKKAGEKRKVEDWSLDRGSFEGSVALGETVRRSRAECVAAREKMQEAERVAEEKMETRKKKTHRPRVAFPDLKPLYTLISSPADTATPNSAAEFTFQYPVLAPTDQDALHNTMQASAPTAPGAPSPLPLTSSFYWNKPRKTSFNKSFGSDDDDKPDAVSSF